MTSRRPIWLYSLLLLSGVGYVWMNYFLVRGDFANENQSHLLPFLLAQTALSAVYLLAIRYAAPSRDYIPFLSMGILFRIALIAAIPNLSDDFYRFIWDGRLWNMGMDPLAEMPQDMWATQSEAFQQAMADIYPHLNSKQYYTVYPPVLQWVFRLGTSLFPTGITGPVIVMKASILLAELASLRLLHLLVQSFGLHKNAVLLYALNPLVIIELSGNLHFEAFMVTGVLATIWFLRSGKLIPAAMGMTLAIGAKLIPLLFFPLWFKQVGAKKWLLHGVLTGVLCTLLFLPILNPTALSHFLESVSLYYQKFEFNASIYYFLVGIFGQDFTRFFGKVLPLIAIGIILYASYKNDGKNWKILPALLVLGYGGYELLATTVHPWYQAPLVAFAALSRYRWPILFSLLIPYTYFAYWNDYQLPTWIIWLEYGAIFAFLAYEWMFVRTGKTLEEWVLEREFFKKIIQKSIPGRVAIKLERIRSRIQPGEKVLDMGTGNGGLLRELQKSGIDITSVDVKNISFFADAQPIIYDGETLPFPDKSFDVVTIITVLHHTPDPEILLREARRVARKRIIIMEDIYRNAAQKHLTFFMDSLVNLEFEGHPHTNRTDAGWKETFARMQLRLTDEEHFRTLVFFSQVIYVVEVSGENLATPGN